MTSHSNMKTTGEIIEEISDIVDFHDWDKVKLLLFELSESSFNDGFEKGKALRQFKSAM